MYKLFLDDLRDPPGDDFVVARTSCEAIDIVSRRGMPGLISFDHDLGGDDTAIVFINAIIEKVLDRELIFPNGFSYRIHSANPVGSENIRSKMDCILKHLS